MEEEGRPLTFVKFVHFDHSIQIVVTEFKHLFDLLNHSYDSCSKFCQTQCGSRVYLQLWHQERLKNKIGHPKNFDAATVQIVEDGSAVKNNTKFH